MCLGDFGKLIFFCNYYSINLGYSKITFLIVKLYEVIIMVIKSRKMDECGI